MVNTRRARASAWASRARFSGSAVLLRAQANLLSLSLSSACTPRRPSLTGARPRTRTPAAASRSRLPASPSPCEYGPRARAALLMSLSPCLCARALRGRAAWPTDQDSGDDVGPLAPRPGPTRCLQAHEPPPRALCRASSAGQEGPIAPWRVHSCPQVGSWG